MEERRTRAAVDIWIARIGTVFGWSGFVFYILLTVVAVVDLPKAKEGLDYAMPLVLAGLAAVHFLIIRVSKRTRELVSDFRYYASILAADKSISELSRKVREPQDAVEKKLILMCKRGYFKGRVDLAEGSLKLDSAPCVARCPGCGATTKIYKSGDVCRYCGNPLDAGESDPS